MSNDTTRRGKRGFGSYRKRGKNNWELRFASRSVSFKGTEREAKAKLRALVVEADNGTLVEPSKATVADYVSERIDTWEKTGRKGREPISPKTAERYRELLENQIKPFIGSKGLQKLSTLDIETWHATLKTEGRKDGKGGLGDRTVLHAHCLISKAMEDAARHNLVARNVAAVQGAPGVSEDPETEIAILGENRIKALIAGLRGRAMYAPAITALFTGLRRGELLALRSQDIDLDARVLSVRAALEETKQGIRFKSAKTKSGRREVTLPDIVVDALTDHRREQLELRVALGLGKLPDDALLFPTLEGEPKSPRAFSAAWADVADSLDMGDITFHALRHTHASQLIDAGIDVVTVSKRLGHANPNITLRIYAHLFRKHDDKAADAINAALAGFGQS